MLALGEPAYEPYRYQPLIIPSRHALLERGYAQASCSADDREDDAIGGPTAFVHSSAQMRALSGTRAEFARIRWGRLGSRRAY